MKKLLISNVAYGNMYTELFLNQHLKSFLDASNIPAIKDRIEYMIFSDKESLPMISNHENFIKLKETIGEMSIHIGEIGWPENPVDKFNARYNVLMACFTETVKKALEKDMYCMTITSDLVAARKFLPQVIDRMDQGHDAVFMQPPRCAAESVVHELNKYPRAMHAEDLWTLCYHNMHPLWVACHWNATQFTKLPFSLLWNSGQGLMARSFSITPVIFQPTEAMLKPEGVVDRFVPSLCKNPYWATDWLDAPLLGVEPLFCYYPPFGNHRATTEWVKGWTKQMLHPSQFQWSGKKLYYPSKELANIPERMEKESDEVLAGILGDALPHFGPDIDGDAASIMGLNG